MSIEKMIHEVYAASSAVTGLIPTSKFVTGKASGLSLPYLQLSREGNPIAFRSNGVSRFEKPVVRMQFWHASQEAGGQLRDLLVDLFDNRDMLAGNRRVLYMRKTNDLEIQEDDGVWQFLIDFELLTSKS